MIHWGCDRMNNQRKETILNEIIYWKENRLLPEQYCNYLIALYSEGEGIKNHTSTNKQKKRNDSFLYIIGMLMLPISVIILYFTDLSIYLQTGILAVFVVLCLGLGIYFSKKAFWYPYFYLIGAFCFLLITIHLCMTFYPNRLIVLYVAIILHCLVWLFTGWKLRLIYFTVSGILGLCVAIISIFI